MTVEAPGTGIDALEGGLRLEDLVDRNALEELCQSFFALFGIPLRVFTADGLLLADAGTEHELCAYVNTLSKGRLACGTTVDGAKNADPGTEGDVTHPCFTGQVYRIIGIDYDARRIGKLILGPYAPAALAKPPEQVLAIDEQIEPEKIYLSLAKVPRVKPEAALRIGKHLQSTLDLILFSGHKSLLTSTMHLASVRESYRELQEKNAKLQDAFDRLRELDRLKSNFLATVSHELRTPLTSIIGYSEMLKEGIAGPLAGEQVEFVQTIHEKGEQLLALIMGLLDLSKLESGTMTLRRKSTHIVPVLNEVLTTVTPAARKKGVVVKVEDDGKPCELRADPERLRQVFINLVDNAIKFTPAEGTVTMRSRVIDGSDGEEEGAGFSLLAPVQTSIEVRVMDTGIGIPPTERAKVFDPFYQVDSSSTREYGGTGLGLSIVKRLVEAHGGSIRIEGNEPNGAVFVVTIPSAASGPLRRSSVPPPLGPGSGSR